MQPWFITLPFLNVIDCAPKEQYHAARFEKESRYYVIRLSKDLLEDWVITLINGRIKSKMGQTRTVAFSNFKEGFEHFCIQAKIRHQRGYQLKTISCDNHLILYLLPFMVHTEKKEEWPSDKNIKRVNQREHQNKKSSSILSNVLPQAPSQQLGFVF